MDLKTDPNPRATIVSWALFLILIVVGAGFIAMLSGEVLAGAIMMSSACLSLTILARPAA